MNSTLYKNYADTIREVLVSGKRRGELKKSQDSFNFSGPERQVSNSQWLNETTDMALFSSLEPINDLVGRKVKYHEKPGQHPDFSHLKSTGSHEYHYITSMFIDIRNSTGLFRKYDPITVAHITSVMQRAAIHTCWHFDGYVQRFQGDGLFVYFGGKNMSLTQSVKNAINAASLFSYFIKNDLKNVLGELGVDSIYTRIGIDTGYEQDVLWHMAGMKDCSEITTCSLHTSLASKMQSNADSNGIMLGDNCKLNSTLASDLFSIKSVNGKEERYIFQIPEENFNYTQWHFNWDKYFRGHPAFTVDSSGNISIKSSTPEIIVNPQLNKEYLRANVDGYKPYCK